MDRTSARQSRHAQSLFIVVASMVACDIIVAWLCVARLGRSTVLSQLVTHDAVEQQRALLCAVIITLV